MKQLTQQEVLQKMQKSKRLMSSLKVLHDMSKKYKTTFTFGTSEVVIDNRKEEEGEKEFSDQKLMSMQGHNDILRNKIRSLLSQQRREIIKKIEKRIAVLKGLCKEEDPKCIGGSCVYRFAIEELEVLRDALVKEEEGV